MGEKRLWIGIISCFEIIVYVLVVGNSSMELLSMREQKAWISFSTAIHFLFNEILGQVFVFVFWLGSENHRECI